MSNEERKVNFPRLPRSIILFYLLSSLFLFVLISCQNPLLPPKRGASLPANTGSFSFTIGGNNARTILPSTPVLGDFAMYTLAFTAAGGGAVNLSADRNNTNLANPIVLAAGTYDLTVSAYKDTGKTQLMAQGTTSGIVITAGGNTARSVVLKPLLGETGTSGTFSWDIGISASGITFSTVSMTIKDSAGVQSDIVVDLTAAPSGSRTLASGIYTVTFTLEGTENGVRKAVVFNEILYIYSELTSRFPSSETYTFSDAHFHTTHWNITFDENYAGGTAAQQSVPHGGTYTVAGGPVRGCYVFDGWDTAANGSGTRYMPGDGIPVHADMTLYAQWVEYIEYLTAQLNALPAGTAGSPATVTLAPAVFTTAATVPDGITGWGDITAAVIAAAKYVTLDLSNISFDGNTVTGKYTASGNDMNTAQSDYIKGITLPDSLTSIGSYAFSRCTALASVDLPGSLTSIEGYAFYQCSGLTGSLTIPGSVAIIGSSAFDQCSGFSGSLTISAGVTTIGGSAFDGCSGLTGSLTIPDSVTSIGAAAFAECAGFSGSLTIPAGVTTIGDHTFYRCRGLTGSLTIPGSVTSIGTYAFYYCAGLTGSLVIPSGVTIIESNTFQGCSGFTGVTIPGSVTSIGIGAFRYCSGLTSADIASSVTTIRDGAFRDCTSLTGVIIPDNVTSLSAVFYNCTSLASVIIPANLTTLSSSTFGGCTGLISVTFNGGSTSFESTIDHFVDVVNTVSLNAAYTDVTNGGAGTYTRPNTTSTVWTKQP